MMGTEEHHTNAASPADAALRIGVNTPSVAQFQTAIRGTAVYARPTVVDIPDSNPGPGPQAIKDLEGDQLNFNVQG